MDLSKQLKALRDFYDSPEGQESIKKFHRLRDHYDNRIKAIHEYLETKTDAELKVMAESFFAREKKYQDYMYDVRHCETNSRIFGSLIGVADQYGTELKIKDEDFLSGAVKYRGYSFKTYCGQGCFTRVSKGKKGYI
jgi:hypothetical protein